MHAFEKSPLNKRRIVRPRCWMDVIGSGRLCITEPVGQEAAWAGGGHGDTGVQTAVVRYVYGLRYPSALFIILYQFKLCSFGHVVFPRR